MARTGTLTEGVWTWFPSSAADRKGGNVLIYVDVRSGDVVRAGFARR